MFGLSKKPDEQKSMPDGVDFSALWEEPDTGSSSLATIASFAAAIISLILLVIKLTGH